MSQYLVEVHNSLNEYLLDDQALKTQNHVW